MPSFIAESYLPQSRGADVPSIAERARRAAETLAGNGRDVAYLRSAFLPEDELCLHWFTASSSAVVAEVASLAALEWDRVVEALEWRPNEERRGMQMAISAGPAGKPNQTTGGEVR